MLAHEVTEVVPDVEPLPHERHPDTRPPERGNPEGLPRDHECAHQRGRAPLWGCALFFPQDGPPVRGEVPNSIKFFVQPEHGVHVRHKDKMVDFAGPSSPLINAAYLSGEHKSCWYPAGGWDLPFNGGLQVRFQSVKAIFRINQFILKLRQPPGMGEITRSNEGDPFLLSPEGKMLGIQVARGGSGEMRMDMKVGDEFHTRDYSPSGSACQPFTHFLKDVTQMVFYLLFRYGAEQFVDLFSVLEENHGGRTHDIVLGCGEGILIYIHLPHFDLACIL